DANSGLELDRQRHTQPVLAVSDKNVSVLELLAQVARVGEGAAPIAAGDIVATDVRLFDTQPPARIGAKREFFASPRLDNLSSTFAGLAALIDAEPAPGTISVFASCDHE